MQDRALTPFFMHRSVLLLTTCLAAVSATPAAADTVVYESIQQETQSGSSRYVSSAQSRAEREAIAAYGPFRVLDERTAALVAATDARSPAAFRAMLSAHPRITTLSFVECPGTYDDRANLALGRMIRAAGLAAVVPEGGSVRSGAVELVLAGTSLRIDDGAEFAVHAWEDQDGYEAGDYAADSHENNKYLAYYREMGMSAAGATAFYAMTNSVPFEDARWLSGAEMRGWVGRREGPDTRLAFLDLSPAVN